MDLGLRGRIAVVTGASKGIGLAVTRALADEGASVVAGARTVGALDGLDRVTGVEVDLSEADAPGRLVRRALDLYGMVDVLVNNVGGLTLRLDGFLSTTDADFDRAMQLNFFTALRATRAALASMVERGSGAIVNIASVNAFYQPDGATIDYGAAKAALVNLTKSLSQEFGPRGIRVNAISPGPVSTDLWLGEDGVAATVGRRAGIGAAAARASIVSAMGGIPTGRFTTPEEVATLAALLASDRSGNVTGANYVIDGGLIKTT